MITFDFPQYRKLANEKAFYEIVDDQHFNEKQCIGKQVFTIYVKAKQYPEILRIQDMLACTDGFMASSEVEFLSIG